MQLHACPATADPPCPTKSLDGSVVAELNAAFNRRFHLTLWVKVRENWADNARSLKQLGLE